jgi:hypothetical protein
MIAFNMFSFLSATLSGSRTADQASFDLIAASKNFLAGCPHATQRSLANFLDRELGR